MEPIYESDFLKLPESEQKKLKEMLKDVEIPTSGKEYLQNFIEALKNPIERPLILPLDNPNLPE